MDKSTTIPWDTADHLETAEDIVEYLVALFEDGDPELMAHGLGVITRSKAMVEIAQRSDLDWQHLYKPISPDDQLEFTTVVKVIKALGLKLTVAAE